MTMARVVDRNIRALLGQRQQQDGRRKLQEHGDGTSPKAERLTGCDVRHRAMRDTVEIAAEVT